MSDLFAILLILVILAIPVLLIILLVRVALKKPVTKIAIAMAVCAASIIPMSILGALTDPASRCEHEYVIVEDIPATCTEQGKVIKECPLCDTQTTEKVDVTGHKWETERVVSATCTSGGYIVERCVQCSASQQTDADKALGHTMVEVSRVDPTYEAAGSVVTRCERCDHEESETIAQLEMETITFDNLELAFGPYSFTTVDNMFSEYDGDEVVKIPVTITNVSDDPHSLNSFYCTLFGSSGSESGNVGYLFSDDVSQAGELLPGKSYTKYFHIVYDGDGTYTIYLDNWFYDEETIEIFVTK